LTFSISKKEFYYLYYELFHCIFNRRLPLYITSTIADLTIGDFLHIRQQFDVDKMYKI